MARRPIEPQIKQDLKRNIEVKVKEINYELGR